MSEISQLVLLSQYNQLMNQRLYEACGTLSNKQRNESMGAFFDSIDRTLNHILIGDILWLNRFYKHKASFCSLKKLDGFPVPESLEQILYDDFQQLKQKRGELDGILIDWVNELNDEVINENMSYHNYAGEAHCKNLGALVLHLFLHQTHHRGQITTLLSQLGVDFGDTDLPEIVPDVVN